MAEAPSNVEEQPEEPTKTSGPPPKDPEGLLRYILQNALELNASTIHFEPTEKRTQGSI